MPHTINPSLPARTVTRRISWHSSTVFPSTLSRTYRRLRSSSAKSRNIQVVLLLYKTGSVSVTGERIASFKRRSGIEAWNTLIFSTDEAAASTRALEAILRRASNEHYFEEVRFIKKHKEKITKSSQIKLFVRHHLKIAFYFELRANTQAAIKYYASAYGYLLDVKKVWRDFGEIKALAEVIIFKTCYHYLELKNLDHAISQFHQHINYYRSLTGDPEYEFRHLAWVARQYQVFGELLLTFYHSTDTTQSKSSFAPRSASKRINWSNPGFYFQAASSYQTLRRKCAQKLCEPHKHKDGVTALSEYILPYEKSFYNFKMDKYVGQTSGIATLDVSKLDANMTNYVNTLNSRTILNAFMNWDANARLDHSRLVVRLSPEILAYLRDGYLVAVTQELRTNHPKMIIDLLEMTKKTYLENESGSRRVLAYLSFRMAQEYCQMQNYQASKEINDQVIPFYRCEKWWELLIPASRERLECLKHLEQWEDFSRYGIELISLDHQLEKSEKISILAALLRELRAHPPSAPIVCSLNTHSLMACRVQFDQDRAFVHTEVKLKIVLKSYFPAEIHFSALKLTFSDPEYNLTVIDCEASDASTAERTESLRFELDAVKIYEFSFLFKRATRLECTAVTLSLGSSPSSIELRKEILREQSVRRRGDEWASRPAVDVRTREPDVDFAIEQQVPAFIGEHLLIKVTVKNQTDTPISGHISIYSNSSSLSDSPSKSDQYLLTTDTPTGKTLKMPFYSTKGVTSRNSHKIMLDDIQPFDQVEETLYFVAPPYEEEFCYIVGILYETSIYSDFVHKSMRIPVKQPFRVQFQLYDQHFKQVKWTTVSPPPRSTMPPDDDEGSNNYSSSPPIAKIPQNAQFFLNANIQSLAHGTIKLAAIKLTHNSDAPIQVELFTHNDAYHPPTDNHMNCLALDVLMQHNDVYSTWIPIRTLPAVKINEFSSQFKIDWHRTITPKTTVYALSGPRLTTEVLPFVARTEIPSPCGTVGHAIEHRTYLTNQTNQTLQVAMQLIEASSFAVAGEKTVNYIINAHHTITIMHCMFPLQPGILACPTVKLTGQTRDASGTLSNTYSLDLVHSSIYVTSGLATPGRQI